jgi:hypothetical protein
MEGVLMAGDWIKVEKSTALKPEIRRISRTCGIDVGNAFYAWFRLWSFFDDQVTGDGILSGFTRSDIDEVAGVPKMSEALELVRWMEWHDADVARITNWERHNSQGAKIRALTLKRQSKFRRRQADGGRD